MSGAGDKILYEIEIIIMIEHDEVDKAEALLYAAMIKYHKVGMYHHRIVSFRFVSCRVLPSCGLMDFRSCDLHFYLDQHDVRT